MIFRWYCRETSGTGGKVHLPMYMELGQPRGQMISQREAVTREEHMQKLDVSPSNSKDGMFLAELSISVRTDIQLSIVLVSQSLPLVLEQE